MVNWRVGPSTISGTTSVPGDKSIAHRALIFAALAQGRSVIRNLPNGEDVQSTARCLRAMGVLIHRDGDTAIVESAGHLQRPMGPLDCGNSGTTMRLLTGVLAAQPFHSRLVGDESLSRRPMMRIIEPLQHMGARITSRFGFAPLDIDGAPLLYTDYALPIASAQVKSAILLAGLQTNGHTLVRESIPSRDHTERMLAALGVPVERYGGAISITRSLPLRPFEITIPGDPSSAAFLLCAAAIHGTTVTIENLGLNPTRVAVLTLLGDTGARIVLKEDHQELGEPVGTATITAGAYNPFAINEATFPLLIDEVPVLSVVATRLHGTSLVRDAKELRVKETDRIEAICKSLTALGGSVKEYPEGLDVNGPTTLRGATVSSFGDHRIAMALAVAGTVADGETVVGGANAAAISWPNFVETFRSLGAAIAGE